MIQKVKSAMLAMQRHSWEQAVCAQSLLESGDFETVVQMCYEAVNRQTEDGRLANIGGQNAVTDPVAIVPAMVKACEITGDPVLKAALEKAVRWMLEGAPRSSKGIIYHMDNASEFWVDSMYMLPPSLLSVGYADEAVKQADGYIDALWDSERHLFRHIWDDAKQEFRVGEYWGVGNGWAIMGLSRLIEYLPEKMAADRERYIEIAGKTIKAALALKNSEDLFYNFLDKPDSFLEVGFAMTLCYTVAKGVKQGWLPEALLSEVGPIRAAAHKHISPYGIVTEVCGAPHFDKSGFAPEGQAFCVLMESVAAATQD
ncbi:MAG: glycoside hydrolase family 88 protein [Oscillospiraceae bacterium]|nr:glycoside hydrolase family 88 protein [Oscillospiraceae bacterium]